MRPCALARRATSPWKNFVKLDQLENFWLEHVAFTVQISFHLLSLRIVLPEMHNCE
jgi:hypothetical protein